MNDRIEWQEPQPPETMALLVVSPGWFDGVQGNERWATPADLARAGYVPAPATQEPVGAAEWLYANHPNWECVYVEAFKVWSARIPLWSKDCPNTTFPGRTAKEAAECMAKELGWVASPPAAPAQDAMWDRVRKILEPYTGNYDNPDHAAERLVKTVSELAHGREAALAAQSKAEQELAAARRDRESWAAIDDQRCAELRKAEQERDRANSDVADACNRLQTIVDEAWGQQPVLSLDNLLSIVEREAFKDRQRCEQMRAVWAPVFEAANDLNTLGWCGAGCDALLRAATKAAKEIAALPACPGPAEPSVLAAGPDKYDGGERTYAEYRANVERLFPNAESYHVPARFVEPTEPTCDADPALYGNAPSEAAPQRTCEPVREQLAAYAHDAWAGWMRYLFDKCAPGYETGTLTMPAWCVERWRRQVATSYAQLPEDEKTSDLAEADKMLAIIQPLPAATRSVQGWAVVSMFDDPNAVAVSVHVRERPPSDFFQPVTVTWSPRPAPKGESK